MWRRDRSGARAASSRRSVAIPRGTEGSLGDHEGPKRPWAARGRTADQGRRVSRDACVQHGRCMCRVCVSRVELELVDRWEKTAPKIVKISPNATRFAKFPPLRGMSASGGLLRRKKSLFSGNRLRQCFSRKTMWKCVFRYDHV